MRDRPRRTLLNGIGSAFVVTTAGCLSFGDDTDESSVDMNSPDFDGSFADLLAAVPGDTVGERTSLAAVNESRFRDAGIRDLVGGFDITHKTRIADLFADDAVVVSKHVTVMGYEPESPFLSVFEPEGGDFDPERDLDVALESALATREHDTGTDYEFAPLAAEAVVAITDNIVFLADSESTIDAALEAHDGDGDAVREAAPRFDDALAAFPDADVRSVITADEWSRTYDELESEDGEYMILAATVAGPDTLEIHHGLSLVDESLVTDALVDQFEETVMGNRDVDGSTEVNGSLLTATVPRDLEAERRAGAHESPSGLSPGELDSDAKYVEIDVLEGDPTPVDELTLELDGEPYDEAIWADGQAEIEGGDTIQVATEDAEPNMPITLRHETEHGGTAETKLYSHFEFTFDYDPDAKAVSVRYEDEFPLDGDHVTLALRDSDRVADPDAEPLRTTTPWTGSELSAGDEATVEHVDPGTFVIVGWDSDTLQGSLANERIRPPGDVAVDYEYETKTATIELTLADDRTRPAAEYTVLRDGDPAAAQWRDADETVSDGDTVELEGVAVGTTIEVVWGEDGHHVGSGVARPSVTFDLTVENGTVTLVHNGGPSLPASELVAEVHVDDEETDVPLDERLDGTFAVDDTVTVVDELERSDPPLKVRVRYGDEYIEDAYNGEL
ncbi:hypothetical protein [Natrinema sp. SYSU A 869]|uniref:hypothetical protein n=1 Tax=Natrinema sp. SYSU A 869 TaxID=2871694 RepID=UPI001CA3DF7E|nr:hypothetical protein [Natrinema sp. SYSU A 869]